jgi:hypothetical protein
MHIMVRLDILQELVRALGTHVNEFFGAAERAVPELCLLVGDVLFALFVTAGTACSHSNEYCYAYHRDDPRLWVAQLEDVQPALCLELVSGDNVCVAGCEVDCCPCDAARDHGGGDAGGDEGRDRDNHDFSVVAVVFLAEEEELAVVSVSV